MDVLSFSRATKVKNEVEKAREEHDDLDERLDEITLMTVLTVATKSGLPVDGVDGKLYLVLNDSTNSNRPTLYTFREGKYERVEGLLVKSSEQNGALKVDNTDVVVYTHPPTHSADIITDGTTKVIMTKAERTKLAGIDNNANNYTHPPTHSADMLIDGVSKKVFTKEEKEKLATIEENANFYVHPVSHSLDEITDTPIYVRMTAEERATLSGLVAEGGEPNQNAFSYIQAGTEQLQADNKTATVKFVGDNVDIQVNNETNEVFFGVTFPEIPEPAVSINLEDESKYSGVVSYINYGENGEVLHKVMLDVGIPKDIKPPVDVLPSSVDSYKAGDTFLVRSEGEVYYCDGTTFIKQSPLIKITHKYSEGLLTRKIIEENYTTPVTKEYQYIYSEGKLIAIKAL